MPLHCASAPPSCLRFLIGPSAKDPCFPGDDTYDPGPWSQPLREIKQVAFLTELFDNLWINFPPHGSAPVPPLCLQRGHTSSPSVLWTFQAVFLFPQYELCGTEVSSEWCKSFLLWRAHCRSLQPWIELCPLTAKKHTWGFLNCYLLSESCMHLLLLLLKYGEVALYLWLHQLWSQLDIGFFQLCKH